MAAGRWCFALFSKTGLCLVNGLGRTADRGGQGAPESAGGRAAESFMSSRVTAAASRSGDGSLCVGFSLPSSPSAARQQVSRGGRRSLWMLCRRFGVLSKQNMKLFRCFVFGELTKL